MSITVVFHHGGKFVYNSTLEYEGGSETAVKEQDVDKWSYFEAVGIVKDLGFEAGSYRIWWKKEEEVHFRRFLSDEAAAELVNHALKFKVEAHIYIEHFEQPGSATEGTNEVTEIGNAEETDEGSDIEDELKGIHMDDSEEERTHGKDDGFGDEQQLHSQPTAPTEATVGTPERGNRANSPQTPIGGSRVVINGTPYRVKSRAKRTPKKRNDASSSAPPEEDVGKLSDGYMTEELNSSDPDEDVEERCKRPKYDRFRVQQLNKDYQFKVGLEFGSLDEFRDAIREWSILNGREIDFDKNKSYRVRCIVRRNVSASANSAPASATSAPASATSASVSTTASATASVSAISAPASATSAPASATSASVSTSASATARMPYKPPAQRIPKLPVKRTRFSTRVKRNVLPYTGPGSDPSKPLQIEDDEGSKKEYNDGCVTQEDLN